MFSLHCHFTRRRKKVSASFSLAFGVYSKRAVEIVVIELEVSDVDKFGISLFGDSSLKRRHR